MVEINEKTIEKVKSVVDGLILKMGVQAKVLAKIDEKEGKEIIYLNIESEEASHLIGRMGNNIYALQHLSRVIIKGKGNLDIPFFIDVNNYRKEREEFLKKAALNTAKKVSLINKEIILRPMIAYERRIVHMCLAEDKLVETDSIGEEPNRRVVIKPVDYN